MSETENPHNVKCDNCSSTRLLAFYCQGRDCHNISYDGLEYEGYMIEGLGLYGNYGDAVDFQLCMQCGKIQGSFPKDDVDIKNEMVESEV